MENPILQLNQVSKRYHLRPAVKKLDFELPSGQVIGLIGANGSGKSTTLKLMAGLIHPTSGTVLIQGKPANRRISQYVSYMSDADTLYSFYTVEQTVNFYQGIFSDFDIEKAREMLIFMRLEPQQRVKELSKGNLGRLKMVLALSRNAPLILMDEPLSGLDPMVRQAIMKGLVSFVDLSKQTLIMSTHEVAEIEPLLDTVVLMSGGEIIEIQEIDQIRMQYNKSLVDWMAEKLEADPYIAHK